jgi:hypothetical protein
MTTQEFYKFAVLVAKERGYENPDVFVHTLCSSSGIKHVCKLWDSNKKKHIQSELQNNPVSALQSFKDAIDFENKTYSQMSEGIEL